ncbi:MAG: hypothetical protein II528_05140, partial [Lachnospiraceae bacterium]|nr:hypothetical protein [Lachnospiraceae bacterium]
IMEKREIKRYIFIAFLAVAVCVISQNFAVFVSFLSVSTFLNLKYRYTTATTTTTRGRAEGLIEEIINASVSAFTVPP